MNPKPQWCHTNCSGSKRAQGFARDSGDPLTARCAFVSESPGQDEVDRGEAMVDKTGLVFNRMLQTAGLPRHEVLICSTLRCRWGINQYPKGALKKSCESACRHWDKDTLGVYSPTHWIITYHPGSIFRTPQFEEYVVKALDLAAGFTKEGRKPVVLLGDKAMEVFAPHLKGGVGTWKGHWWEEADDNKTWKV